MCVETFLTELEESGRAACAGVSSLLCEVLVRCPSLGEQRPPELAWAAGLSGGALKREVVDGLSLGIPGFWISLGPDSHSWETLDRRPPAASQEMW